MFERQLYQEMPERLSQRTPPSSFFWFWMKPAKTYLSYISSFTNSIASVVRFEILLLLLVAGLLMLLLLLMPIDVYIRMRMRMRIRMRMRMRMRIRIRIRIRIRMRKMYFEKNSPENTICVLRLMWYRVEWYRPQLPSVPNRND